jgi:hypothetical protein
MKRLFTLTMVVALLTAGAAVAAPWQIAPNATFAAGSPATTNNDDSCDISNQPAATLLLPVFEVDIANTNRNTAVDTLFTITNTSNIPQIAHITIWTDWSVPVLDFNVFLTGYDVQAISLYDVIARGVLPGGGSQVGVGSLSAANNANPNHAPGAVAACDNLPTQIPQVILQDLRTSLTTGTVAACSAANRVGSNNHGANAIGYVTIDVGNTCSQSLPTDPNYYTQEILFDNTLIGDYIRVNPTATTGNYAGGDILVPIRAIPEGGPAGGLGGLTATNLPYTFYDRYTPLANRRADRRQPLPSTFAARYISGGVFGTRLAIWREGVTRGLPACGTNAAQNGSLGIAEVVRFDESENPTTHSTLPVPISPVPPGVTLSTPEAGFYTVGATSGAGSNIFPAPSGSADQGGWVYLNLNHTGVAGGLTAPGTQAARAAQNWVQVQMTAESRYGVDFAAAHLGNGCTAPIVGGTRPLGARVAGTATLGTSTDPNRNP